MKKIQMFSIHCNSRIKSWKNQKRSTKNDRIKLFLNKYNWGEINFPSGKDDWKKVEKNNVTTDLNVLYTKKGKNISLFI